jgi:hypothetical protein
MTYFIFISTFLIVIFFISIYPFFTIGNTLNFQTMSIIKMCVITVRRSLPCLLLLIFISSSSSYAQTTEEEYNYLTKGYKIQIESGLDMKKGYRLEPLGEWDLNYGNDGRRGAEFLTLIREDKNEIAGILMIYKRPSTKHATYYCIPSKDAPQSLWDRTLEQLNKDYESTKSKQVLSAISWALMKLASQEVVDSNE